ncbi:MAG: hypothetical protein K2G46_07410, partial [Bacteroidales bacterium]|nr:hypothetical protein [Bacteroidales bacterium]
MAKTPAKPKAGQPAQDPQAAPRTEIGSIGEFPLIDRLTADLPIHNADYTCKGVGDDAAVLQLP